MDYVTDPETKLLKLSEQGDYLTLGEAFEGIFVAGQSGGGKTSGTAEHVVTPLMRGGAGMLILAAKPEAVDSAVRLARENGRENSVILFGETGGYNFITADLARHGFDGLGSVLDNLMLITSSDLASSGGRGSEQFWDDSKRLTLGKTIPVLYSATGTVKITDTVDFIRSAPTSLEEIQDEKWRQSSFMFEMLMKARYEPVHPLGDQTFAQIGSYWRDEWTRLDPKLRGNVMATISAGLDRFTTGRLARALTGATTLVPEMLFQGAIIILNAPTLTWNEDGRRLQVLFKRCTQRAILARNGLPPNQRDRPVAIVVDEAQEFLDPFDAEFQAMGRASRCCTVMLTQSLPNLYARIGGDQPRDRANALLANLSTKIFHSNSCAETNRWAADMIGRTLQRRSNFSESQSAGWSTGMNVGESDGWGTNSGFGFSTDGQGHTSFSSNSGSSRNYSDTVGRNRGSNTGESRSGGYSETMDYAIEPAAFARSLRTGGPANGGKVDAVWFRSGKTFKASGQNYLVVTFNQ